MRMPFVAGLVMACLLCLDRGSGADDRVAVEFFEKRIRPVLVEHCYQCHSAIAKEVKGGLLLDHREGLRKGGESGAAVVPKQVADSLLMRALRHDGLKMPPDGKLPEHVVRDFAHWIAEGAVDPRDTPATPQVATERAKAEQFEQLSRWWSLQPIAASDAARRSGLVASEIDRFIRARLQSAGLKQAPEADRRTLARRLSFLVQGLPPTPDEVTAFLEDTADDAWDKLVDRMLASPHFGERWARHWMDVVRYGDTYGYEWDMPAKGAWRYRDYLVRAFNGDVSFDQLVREHIAGDLLPEPRVNSEEHINESLIGPMFYQLGEKRHGDSSEFDGIHQEMLDNKIDAFSKTFQALTISCARCHDHKLDAVLQREYYALAGSFMSSRWTTNTVDLPARHAAHRTSLEAIKSKLRILMTRQWREDLDSRQGTSPLAGLLARRLKEHTGKEPPLEDWLHPWFKLNQAAESGGSVVETWKTLAAQYATEREQRNRENRSQFAVVADFRRGIPDKWSVDGVGVQSLVACGDFTVALEGDAVIGQVLHGGLVSHALSPRMNGALRTPWLSSLEPGHLSMELAGGDFACRRAVIDNAFLTEKQQYLSNRHPQWVRLDTYGQMRDRHVYLELSTKTSNPNFPPRVGLGGACNEQQVADPRSWFAVSRVVRHQGTATPRDELTRFSRVFAGEAPRTMDEVAERYTESFRMSLDAWEQARAQDDDVSSLNWLLDSGSLTNGGPRVSPEVAALREQYRAAEKRLPEPWTVNGMSDVDPGFDYRLHDRGDYDKLRDPVPRGYLRVLSNGVGPDARTTDAAFKGPRSGRLELANLIANENNPLTARVYVNRVWQWLLGTGLVATTNDFGHLGEQPSHPELLDDLTARFIADRWSTKRLVRAILLTETWKQSSVTDPAAHAVDPTNRWLHHFSLRRLEAEAIRDAMLLVSGRLDRRLSGPTINPHRLKEDPEKRLFSGPLDGLGRRSIYIKMTIMEPPRFLALFNQPPPKIPTGTRDVTNTPAQSLALLNEAFVLDLSEAWARQLVATTDASIERRLDRMFVHAYGRTATADELLRWSNAAREFAEIDAVDAGALMSSVTVWKQVAHACFNTKEFLYVR